MSERTIRFSEIGIIAAISSLLGVFIGSRTGGTYVFEIGKNLLICALTALILGSFLYSIDILMKNKK
ncbi:hypothetical protein CEE45_01730 [Candidatus Heimdallarchaeota archaeon B3_Heim]|nr:MAG: hypothetical protein CEE45_01730 [Candidatus Heimdallarchaeota archaeon B3_Heim]